MPGSLYAQLFHQNNAPMMLVDIDTFDMVDVNEAAAQFYGYTRAAMLKLNMRHLSLTPSVEQQRRAKQVIDGTRSHFLSRNRMGDGSERYVDVYATLIEFEDRRLMHAVVYDASERIHAEDALRAVERRQRLVLDHLPEMICHYDRDYHVTFANAAYCEFTGIPYDELIGRDVREIVPEANMDSFYARVQSLVAGETLDLLENYQTNLLGEQRLVQWADQAVFDEHGQFIEVQAVARDITDTRRMEAALDASQHLIENILATLPDTIYVYDVQAGRNVFANRNIVELLGYNSHEIKAIGRDLFGQLLHPEDFPKVMAHFQAMADSQDSVVHEVEYRMKHRDGDWRTIHSHEVIFRRDEDGIVSQILGHARDVTNYRQQQQQELDIKLERGRLQILSSFIRDASHEFRTPLSIIGSAAHLLARSDDPDRRQYHQQRINAQIEGITRLLNDLITMTRLDVEPITGEQLVPLNQLVVMLCANHERGLMEKNLTLETDLTPFSPVVEANIIELNHALDNILENAIRYTPEGGTITITTGSVEGEATIAIADTGSGIEPRDHERVFDRFFRRDDAHSTAGFGLGLAITRAIVQRYNGMITVESAVGQGSTFHITLPMDSVSPGETAHA